MPYGSREPVAAGARADGWLTSEAGGPDEDVVVNSAQPCTHECRCRHVQQLITGSAHKRDAADRLDLCEEGTFDSGKSPDGGAA